VFPTLIATLALSFNEATNGAERTSLRTNKHHADLRVSARGFVFASLPLPFSALVISGILTIQVHHQVSALMPIIGVMIEKISRLPSRERQMVGYAESVASTQP
jgi:hypothetical protein